MSFKKRLVEPARAYKAVLDAIKQIEKFTAGYTQDQFESDEKTSSAVCFQIVTLGERIYDLNKENYFDNSPFNDRVEWEKIGNMRHFFAHEYYENIKLSILWNTIQHDLPVLKEAIEWHLKEELSV